MAKRDPYDIRKIFEDMTLGLILSLKRNMSRHKEYETEEGFRWEQWQSAKLRSIQEYRKANKLLISKANKEADKLVDTVVKDSYFDGAQRSLSRWDKFLNLILKPFGLQRLPVDSELAIPQDIKPLIKPDPVIWDNLEPPKLEEDFFKLNEKKITALQDAAKKDMHKANQHTMRKMDDIYRQVIYRAEVNMAAGAKTLNQAIDMATKDFLERGIDTIVYADGKRMNIASYAEIALRTVSQRATFAGEGTKRDEWGVYTVVMSAHDNCSPWCLPYQGTVMIDDVYTSISLEDAQQLARNTGYTRLSVAMAEGAFHPACRHTLATFFPGISQLPVVPDQKKARKNYEAEQKQRYMERTIRKYKRLEAGSLDDANQIKYGLKVKQWQGRLKQHLAEHDELKRDKQREDSTLPLEQGGDNGLSNKYLTIPEETTAHASLGDFTNPKNPKKQAVGNFKSGGHGQENINFLKQHAIEYNIVHEYPNGVRIGNVPEHKDKIKKTGTKQSWFPKNWSSEEIAKAGRSVANNKDLSKYELKPNIVNDQVISIFKYSEYKGVTVGICYDVNKRKITTIFPDETQRLTGGE